MSKLIIRHKITKEIICEAEQINGIYDLHKKDLSYADLRGADLRGPDLYGANLYGADLSGADLYGANLRGADLSGADLRGSNLYGSNLYGANLYGADLRGSNLRGADLSGADLRVYQADKWTAYIQREHIRIGCKYFTVDDWKNFTDEEISKMDLNALEYWNKNKKIIFEIHRSLSEVKNG